MNSRFRLSLILGLLAFSATLSAAPVNCAAPPPPAQTVDTTTVPGPGSFSIACGGLTFSNFEVIDAGATLPVIMNLVSAQHDATAGIVYLNFNPNLFAFPGTTEDVHFYFQVTGGITGIDLAVGGTSSIITERACSTPVNRNAGNTCTGGLPNQLAALNNFSGNATVEATFDLASTAYIYKDILADGRRGTTGADLTSFSQSFHTAASPVPEPMTMMLMGAGLSGLGLFRRKGNKTV